MEALEKQGAVNVMAIKLANKLEDMTHMILATGKSPRHMRKMSESIVQAVSS